MRVETVAVGVPRTVSWNGRETRTSIFKTPVAGPVAIRRHDLDGDRQADPTVHGGEYTRGQMKRPVSECPHGAAALPARSARASKKACEACGVTEELRVCQTCGYVGCCESHDAHDEAHFEATGHPFIRPRSGRLFGPPGWLWCYLCKAYLV